VYLTQVRLLPKKPLAVATAVLIGFVVMVVSVVIVVDLVVMVSVKVASRQPQT
jgi:hypothetical protein